MPGFVLDPFALKASSEFRPNADRRLIRVALSIAPRDRSEKAYTCTTPESLRALAADIEFFRKKYDGCTISVHRQDDGGDEYTSAGFYGLSSSHEYPIIVGLIPETEAMRRRRVCQEWKRFHEQRLTAKDSTVWYSDAALRDALKVIESIGGIEEARAFVKRIESYQRPKRIERKMYENTRRWMKRNELA